MQRCKNMITNHPTVRYLCLKFSIFTPLWQYHCSVDKFTSSWLQQNIQFYDGEDDDLTTSTFTALILVLESEILWETEICRRVAQPETIPGMLTVWQCWDSSLQGTMQAVDTLQFQSHTHITSYSDITFASLTLTGHSHFIESIAEVLCSSSPDTWVQQQAPCRPPPWGGYDISCVTWEQTGPTGFVHWPLLSGVTEWKTDRISRLVGGGRVWECQSSTRLRWKM